MSITLYLNPAHATWELLAVSAAWSLLFCIRERHNDSTAAQDLFISCLFVYFVSNSNGSFDVYHIIFSVLVLLVLAILRRPQDVKVQCPNIATKEQGPEVLAKPLIFPCRTTHTRLFPKKHSFSYSYLFVGIPVGWHGRVGTLLSADIPAYRSWFHVDAADYLERDLDNFDLRGKLDHYLTSQGENPSDYPHAYLATAPRFLGYSFNPVSFWYLYSAELELRAMILEVNNTFDERRIYFLPGSPSKDTIETADTPQLEDQDVAAALPLPSSKPTKFSTHWPKDFHVSPFNSRKGAYKLLAHDPCLFQSPNPPSINNTITLLSSSAHAKLVARVFSASPAIDPTTLNTVSALWLVVRRGWVGFVTFPRILREAGTLFFKKKMSVFFRPEVLQGSISRHATETERLLETFFTRYLTHLVENSTDPLVLNYHPAPGTGTSRKLTISSATTITTPTTTKPTTISIHVLSPAFYSNLPHYLSIAEAMIHESSQADPASSTITIDPASSISLLHEHPPPSSTPQPHLPLHWHLLLHLRRSPSGPSHLEHFILQHCTPVEVNTYRLHATQLLLAQRFAFGLTGLVVLADWVVRLSLLWASATAFARLDDGMLEGSPKDWVGKAVLGGGVACAVHLWALLVKAI